MRKILRTGFCLAFTLALLSGCVMPAPNARPWLLDGTTQPTSVEIPQATPIPGLPTLRNPNTPYLTPTPDSGHVLPTLRTGEVQYIVQYGDYMSLIGSYYDLPVESLIAANPEIDPELLEVGQVIIIPAPHPASLISDFKIIPDSELVYGPMSTTLDVDAFVNGYGGYLSSYRLEVEGKVLSGAQIIKRICYEYSVNPRLILALLEYQSGWVTRSSVDDSTKIYPMGYFEEYHQGLYLQLAWTADQLNRAYYAWKDDALAYATLSDASLVMLSPAINAGTAAVQVYLGKHTNLSSYPYAISPDGLYATYVNFFGIPFDFTYEPLVPEGLTQPELILPFETGKVWFLTSGPHGGWGSGSAWAAIDFAPPAEVRGCVDSDEWVTASADGMIIRAANGAVVQDLDGDGLEQTGWTILYMHIETRDRVKAGTTLKAGDRIGHPSCEGGYSNGTHTHIARRYNGEWIPADGSLPLILSGWRSVSDGVEYDGNLIKDDQIVIAVDAPIDENQIQR